MWPSAKGEAKRLQTLVNPCLFCEAFFLGLRMAVSKNHVLAQSLRTGEVLICDFDSGFKPPEMVKKRPVVVVSRTSTHWRGLCTVVPISTTDPIKQMPWHVLLFENPLAGHMPEEHPFSKKGICWVKCDMLYTVAFSRLSRPHKRAFGARNYSRASLPHNDLNGVFKAIYAYLPEPRQALSFHGVLLAPPV